MTEEQFNLLKGIALILASIVGVISFIVAYVEYRRTAKLKRIDLYNEYRDKMIKDVNLRNILILLEDDNGFELRRISRMKRYKFIGYYEDIALLLNSKFIKPEIAHYMFAYYAKKCWYNKDFWHDINKESHYWRVFKEFILKMEELEQKNLTIPIKAELKFKL